MTENSKYCSRTCSAHIRVQNENYSTYRNIEKFTLRRTQYTLLLLIHRANFVHLFWLLRKIHVEKVFFFFFAPMNNTGKLVVIYICVCCVCPTYLQLAFQHQQKMEKPRKRRKCKQTKNACYRKNNNQIAFFFNLNGYHPLAVSLPFFSFSFCHSVTAVIRRVFYLLFVFFFFFFGFHVVDFVFFVLFLGSFSFFFVRLNSSIWAEYLLYHPYLIEYLMSWVIS